MPFGINLGVINPIKKKVMLVVGIILGVAVLAIIICLIVYVQLYKKCKKNSESFRRRERLSKSKSSSSTLTDKAEELIEDIKDLFSSDKKKKQTFKRRK